LYKNPKLDALSVPLGFAVLSELVQMMRKAQKTRSTPARDE